MYMQPASWHAVLVRKDT